MKKLILLLLSLQCVFSNIALAQNPGDLDITFSTDGKLTRPKAPWMDVAIQPDGKVLAVGDIIARYNLNGSLDTGFSSDGVDTVKINDTIYSFNAVGVQPDGKILVAGGRAYGNTGLKDFLVMRYNIDGTRDSSFDGDGVVRTKINSWSDDYAYELAIQTDGKVLVAGASNTVLSLCRYHSGGSLDSTFDFDGRRILNGVGINFSIDRKTYMKVQSDGKIIAGSAGIVARLNADGSLDNNFGANGMVGLPHFMYDVVIRPDGKIVLAGGGTHFAIVRLDTDGSLDNNFGNGGITTTYWQGSSCSNPRQVATSIALQADGRILAGGYNICCILSNCKDFVLIRYNENGVADSSFGSNSKVVTPFSPSAAGSFASAITPDFKIVLAGYDNYLGGPEYGFMARYHLGWLLDVNTVFGNDEGFVISPNPTSDCINIEASKIENGVWHCRILDITGRPVLQQDIVATNGSLQKKVSLEALPAGVYLLQLDNGKKKTVSRVVKYGN